jgi:hypothetical protein
MKRYHAVKGSGKGIEHVITSEDLGKHAMWEEENHGAWVLYREAKAEIDALHSRFAGSNPGKHSDRQSAIDAYLTDTKFHIGSRVRRSPTMTGIVTGAPRKSRYSGTDQSTYVDVQVEGSHSNTTWDVDLITLEPAVVTQNNVDAARDAGYKEGHDAAFNSTIAGMIKDAISGTKPDNDQHRKALVNELYHDRARLERILANVVKLLKRVVEHQDRAGGRIHKLSEEGQGLLNEVKGFIANNDRTDEG